MAVTISGARTTSLVPAGDEDGDGQFDSGDIVITRIRITSSGSDPALDVAVTDTLNGLTLDPASVQVTPILAPRPHAVSTAPSYSVGSALRKIDSGPTDRLE
jgi:hypothetical protein